MTDDGQKVRAVLTIAGSDCSGGAGIQADLKTFSALGVYGASVVTALTAQNTTGVKGVHVVPAQFVEAQIRAVFDDLDVRAVKTGMLAEAAIVNVVCGQLRQWGRGAIVVDPVMVATSGDRLLAAEAEGVIRRDLLALATLITPNLPEAAALLDCSPANGETEMEEQGRRLLEFGPAAVLMKGGHADNRAGEKEAVDLLIQRTGAVVRLARPWIETRNTHGTGCTLSAAVAAGLAKGLSLPDAVEQAKTYLWNAIRAGSDKVVGAGRGPVDHGHNLR